MSDRCFPHKARCCRTCAGTTAPEPSCIFPMCPEEARPDHPTCELHQNVRVTGSWVESAKHEDDGGN